MLQCKAIGGVGRFEFDHQMIRLNRSILASCALVIATMLVGDEVFVLVGIGLK